MKLQKVQKLKRWHYLYDSQEEKEIHKTFMLLGEGFTVEKESDLEIIFVQVISESD